MTVSRAIEYARLHQSHFTAQLKRFISFPSVSAQPEHAADIRRCALWLARHLHKIGMDRVMLVPTSGNPLVFASSTRHPARFTLLIYGHYDVQPADRRDGWRFPPFSPVVQGSNIYGRGASDDKGQLFVHVKALESCLKSGAQLPINVKCIFEGEEEIGSPHLFATLARIRPALQADAALMSDMAIPAPDKPAITIGLRGSLNMQVEVSGPGHDLHSGQYGGAVYNPLQALCEVLAQLHDSTGRIAIPGFYDDVREWSKKLRDYFRSVAPSDEQMMKSATQKESWGETSYSAYERTTLRPSLDISGISGGHEGSGNKAVIPSKARAKIGFRLVPDQRAKEIEALVRDYLVRITPPTMRLSVHTFSMSDPVSFDPDGLVIRAVARAYLKGFGELPVFLRSGGTIPVANYLSQELGLPTVLMGFGLPDDGAHGPNEKFYLPNFRHGIVSSMCLMDDLAKRSPTSAPSHDTDSLAEVP